MELILWRHAQALEPQQGQSDLERQLTKKRTKAGKTNGALAPNSYASQHANFG